MKTVDEWEAIYLGTGLDFGVRELIAAVQSDALGRPVSLPAPEGGEPETGPGETVVDHHE